MKTNYYHKDSLMDTRYIYSYTDSGHSYTIYRYNETVVHVNVRKEGYHCDYIFYDTISPNTLRSKDEYWENSRGFAEQSRYEFKIGRASWREREEEAERSGADE